MGTEILVSEGTMLEFESELVDYQFMTTKSYTDGPNGIKSSRTMKYSQVVLSLHADNTYCVSSIWGHLLVKMSLAEELGDEDHIIKMASPPTGDDPFFVILSAHGKMFIVHYQMIDSAEAYLKYI